MSNRGLPKNCIHDNWVYDNAVYFPYELFMTLSEFVRFYCYFSEIDFIVVVNIFHDVDLSRWLRRKRGWYRPSQVLLRRQRGRCFVKQHSTHTNVWISHRSSVLCTINDKQNILRLNFCHRNCKSAYYYFISVAVCPHGAFACCQHFEWHLTT